MPSLYKRLSIILSILLLSGCANALPADYVSNSPAVVDIAPSEDAQTTPDEAQNPLRIPIPDNPVTLNPIEVREAETANFLSLIYESPLYLDENAKPQPELFESWEADGAEWTFNVRNGVKWHGSGTALTAWDIESTLNKITTPFEADGSEIYSIYYESARLIESYRAVDDSTFKLTAFYPGQDVLYALCFPVMPKDNDSPLIGTGPYAVQTRSDGGEYTLAVNQSWWKQKPSIETIIAKPMKNVSDRIMAYEKKELDLVYESASNAPRYTAFTNTSVREVATRYYYYLLPNLSNKYLKDINFRQALSSAINRKDIIFTSVYGYGVAAENAITPDSWLFDMNADHMEYNESNAIEYLRAGGYGYIDSKGARYNQENVASLRLVLPDDKENGTKTDIADVIKSSLAKLGVTIEVSALGADEYTAAIEAGDYDITICKVYLDTVPNPEKLYATDGELNLNHYSSSAMDASLQATRAGDEKSYQQAYIDIQRVAGSDMPAIGLFFQTAAVIYHNNIKGIGRMNDLRIFKGIPKWRISGD